MSPVEVILLIDMTVGKGGDFPKWIAAKLSFVFGLDIHPDNIQNRINGACARFLNYRKKWKNNASSIICFSADSGLNIRGRSKEGEECPSLFYRQG